MRIAFLLFDELTLLDLVGLYDPITRLKTMEFLPELSWELCAPTAEVRDDRGLRVAATQVGGSLAGYDLLIAPGGFGTRGLMKDGAFMEWLATAKDVPLKASVCTGALLYGAAGWLHGRQATTHPRAYDLLRPYCAEVLDQRIVDEGPIVTARGVTSSIDLGLYLCERLADRMAAERIRDQMDYPYRV